MTARRHACSCQINICPFGPFNFSPLPQVLLFYPNGRRVSTEEPGIHQVLINLMPGAATRGASSASRAALQLQQVQHKEADFFSSPISARSGAPAWGQTSQSVVVLCCNHSIDNQTLKGRAFLSVCFCDHDRRVCKSFAVHAMCGPTCEVDTCLVWGVMHSHRQLSLLLSCRQKHSLGLSQ